MDLFDIVISGKINRGGGSSVTVEPLSVTENGTYSASSGYAFDPVSVSVPTGIFPSGTSDITSNGIYDVTSFSSASVNVPMPSGTSAITANGIYDIASFASASVNVPIPSGYIQPTGTSSITSNGIYDITSFASVDVNVSGGGGGDHTAEDAIVTRTISAYENIRVTSIGSYAFVGCLELTAISFPNVTSIGGSICSGCRSLTTVNLFNLASVTTGAFSACSALSTVSFPNVTSIANSAFAGCKSLTEVIILSPTVAKLQNTNAFATTPMSNSTYTGSFGSIYVPASLVSAYKEANNWSVYSDRITSYVE